MNLLSKCSDLNYDYINLKNKMRKNFLKNNLLEKKTDFSERKIKLFSECFTI